MNETKVIQALVREGLQAALDTVREGEYDLPDWTLQGFGMLRTYIGDSHRLHVWDDRYAVDNVSTVHTHPWDFDSLVIAGSVHNIRYWDVTEARYADEQFLCQSIRCGVGGGLEGAPVLVNLKSAGAEVVVAGETYTQHADEIHESRPSRGTVTLIERRVPEGGDPDYAYVYFQGEWVSAEPRKATYEEIEDIISYSLDHQFA